MTGKARFTQGLLNNDAVLNALQIQPGQTILDAGCGNGYMSRLFCAATGSSGKVWAMDPDPYFIEVLLKETIGTHIIPVKADITRQTPLKAASIDLVYLSAVLHQFSPEQIKGVRKEVVRLLRPEGILAIVEMDKKPSPFGPPVSSRLSPEDLKQFFRLPAMAARQAGEYFYLQCFCNAGGSVRALPGT